MGTSKTHIKLILRTLDRIVNMPREVAVVKTKRPSGFENISVIMIKIIRTVRDVVR